MQDQMNVLNPIYVAPNMTALIRMTILNIYFALFCLIKRDRRFPFAKRDISEWASRYEQKIINAGSLTNVCRQTPCLSMIQK